MPGTITLAAGTTEVRLAPDAGGRVGGITVDDLELLAGVPADGPLQWGCYPMVPWPGRLGRGVLHFEGAEHRFPLTMAPHAIHGTTWDRPWAVVAQTPTMVRMAVDLAPPWPFGGQAQHTVELSEGALRLRLDVIAGDRPMPAAVGWHPWFRRRLARGSSARLHLPAGAMWERGPDGLPTRQLVPPPPGPWDDCFTDLSGPPVLTWPGALRLAVESACPHVVVYDEQDAAVCVEPQTLPPDGLDHDPPILPPGQRLTATCTLRWSADTGGT